MPFFYDNNFTNFLSSGDFYALIPRFESSIASMIPNKTIGNNVCCTFATFKGMIIPNLPAVFYDGPCMLCNQYVNSANRYLIFDKSQS